MGCIVSQFLENFQGLFMLWLTPAIQRTFVFVHHSTVSKITKNVEELFNLNIHIKQANVIGNSLFDLTST